MPYLLDTIRLNITLESFLKVLVGTMHDTIDVPHDVTGHIHSNSALDKLIPLRFAINTAQEESLHSERFCHVEQFQSAQFLAAKSGVAHLHDQDTPLEWNQLS